jgi:putative membrane protein
MKKKAILLAAVTGLLFACNNESKNSVEKADSANEAKQEVMPESNTGVADEASSSFLVDAANGGMAEVELGKLAQEKATNPQVKEFATMMVNDHTGANAEAKALAAKKSITLPADVTEGKKETASDLSKKTGKDFDKAYMERMVKDHKETIDLFEKASNNVKDADVKNFADMTLPKLRTHLEKAQSIEDALKK